MRLVLGTRDYPATTESRQQFYFSDYLGATMRQLMHNINPVSNE